MLTGHALSCNRADQTIPGDRDAAKKNSRGISALGWVEDRADTVSLTWAKRLVSRV